MLNFDNLRIRSKLLLISLVSTVCFLGLFLWFFQRYSDNIYQEKRTQTRQLVESAVGILQFYAGQAKNSKLPLAEAQRQAKEEIRSLRYGGNNYFWINTADVKMVMHPNMPDLEGKDITDQKDPTGKHMFVEMVDVVKRNNEGFVNYMWPKPGGTKAFPKISYVKLSPDWNWIVGTGIYVDDVVSEINRVRLIAVLVVVPLMAVLFILVFIMSSSISRTINRVVRVMQEMAKGHLDLRLNLVRKDEMGVLSREMDRFADELQNVVIGTIKKISEGEIDIDIPIKDSQDEIRPVLRGTIESLRGLKAETDKLTKAAVEGDLATRGDAARFKGAYREIVQGVNDTLDAVIVPLNVAALYVERISRGDIPDKITVAYRGDFNMIKNNLNTCIDSLRDLIVDDGGLVLQAAANKDLTARMNKTYQGLFEQMKQNINNLMDNLDQALRQVVLGAEQVASASVQVSTGSQALSQGATEQASSLEEISSNLQEMASMTRENAANAKEARSIAEQTRSSSGKGVDSMKRLSDAIGQIKASSDATAKIVKTIDEIAFQTNLLALNAAVEAARAGDAGKGFAVVAEEVRNLAMRSAEAAKNTANLIEEAVKNAENGVIINTEMLRNFNEINGGANKVTEVMIEIAAASEQQDQGIAQVNKAVEQVNQVTQQNAANAEESASAAEEMSSQAEEMRSIVLGFGITVADEPVNRTSYPMNPALHAAMPLAANKKVNRSFGYAVDPKKIIPLDDDDRETLRKF